jgi:HK97 family phage portal protein
MAVNEVSRGAASVPFALFERKGVERERLADHPILRLLKRPNPLQSGHELFEAVYGYLLIAGNSYLEAVGPESKPPRELYSLRPDRMKVIAGPKGLPLGYRFEVEGRAREWRVDPLSGRAGVLHLKTFNPLDDWYGLSPIEACAFSIDQHNEAGKWNQALLQNGARPSGALVFEGELSDEQWAHLRDEFAEKYEGAKNAGRPLLLEGGLKWEAMGHSPKDMDFINAKHTAARDIAIAFGVPPQLLGIPGDNTYSNFREARLALWENTIAPLVAHVAEELNNWLAPAFGQGLELAPDLDEIPALALNRERLWERLGKADWLSAEEKRRFAGVAMRDVS